jgi:hypothetical protein
LAERDREAGDGRVAVDVFHRHRGQIVALADPRAESGHHHGVGVEVVEEVTAAGDRVQAQHIRQYLSVSAFDRGHLVETTFEQGRGHAGIAGELSDVFEHGGPS